MKYILMVGMLFMFSACTFWSKPKPSSKLIGIEIDNLSKAIVALQKECKSESNNTINIEKIDAFITFSKKNSNSIEKIKILNDELMINTKILYILNSYDMKEIKNFDKKERCRTILININGTYHKITKELGYK